MSGVYYTFTMNRNHPSYIPRPLYMNRILKHIGSPLIKVLTGQRRVGKSYMLFQIADTIHQQSPRAAIASINIPRDRFHIPIRTSRDLYEYIIAQFKDTDEIKVVMLDEIQEVPDFEETLSALFEQGGYDIYITGSNSHLLSGELATLLSGRYTQIEIHGLSYQEFLRFHKLDDSDASLGLFLRIGGLPYLHTISDDAVLQEDYFRTVEETILFNDVIGAHKGSSKELFRYLIRFLADTVGSPVSAASISRYLKNQKLTISVPTVISFLETLERSYLIHRSPFFDLSGKQHLDTASKYYFEDTGIRNHLCGGMRAADRSKILEQAVYLSLLQMGYSVRTGRMAKDREIDFVAERAGDTIYVQVCDRFPTQKKIDTEFGNLLIPRDGYRRYMVTQDESLDGTSQDGIGVFSLRSWLTLPHANQDM